MTDREKIRAEVERLKKLSKKNCIESGWDGYDAQVWVLDNVLSFIDSLPEEPTPKGYDEAYLNECIAKASKTWEGVDVDKYMDKVRGRCPKESDDLDKLMKEVQKYYSDNFDYITSDQPTLSILTNIARYFTEWQKRKMMEGVESGEVSAVYKFDNIVTINVVHGRLNTPLYLRLSKYKGLKEGDKVKIIIVKANEQE